MAYFWLYGVFAVWVLFDSGNRKMGGSVILWTLGTFLLGPIMLPIYLAVRPLKRAEIREGGIGWNVLKNFAILWTIAMAIVTIVAMTAIAKSATGLSSTAESAGAGIGAAVGMGFLGTLWFFPTIGAALLGFFLKKDSVIERGPTGTLLSQNSVANPFDGWAGLLSVAVLGLLLLALTDAPGRKADPSTHTSATKVVTSDVRSSLSKTTNNSSVGTDLNGWKVAQKSNAMDGTAEAFLQVEAVNEIPGVINLYRPTLTIQCRKHRSEVVISVGQPLQNEYDEYETYGVRIKFDNGNPVRQRWTGSSDNEGAYSPSPAQLLKQLTKSETLFFEFTPFQRSPQTVEFSVSGLKEKYDSVKDACGTKL